MGEQAERPLSHHLAELKAVGYTIFRGHLDRSTVTALRNVRSVHCSACTRDSTHSSSNFHCTICGHVDQVLEPVFTEAFRADPTVPKLKLGAGSVTGQRAGGGWPGGGLLHHPLWEPVLAPLLHHPWHTDRLFDFCELVMGPQVQLDAFGISGFPAHSPNDPAPPLCPRPPVFSWHRDNFALSQYYTGHDDGGSNGFWGGFQPHYRPPLGINLLCYLQEMNEETGACA